MQEKFLFEYAVIRFVPRVEREEFLNVGVVLLCSAKNFLEACISIDESRIMCLNSETDFQVLQNHLLAFGNIAKGVKGSGVIGFYDIASRFRWLTATRSTIIQCSKVHPGFSVNPQKTLVKLHQQLVL
ncbi:hypothetical protein ABIB40_003226 [Pedobacter sp. UYP30]|uniref:DUF3037 domain-containing protein n=1 Tax=Pedobacter sp. UYP30 TaxID=1756400 RepID=UPI00339799DA